MTPAEVTDRGGGGLKSLFILAHVLNLELGRGQETIPKSPHDTHLSRSDSPTSAIYITGSLVFVPFPVFFFFSSSSVMRAFLWDVGRRCRDKLEVPVLGSVGEKQHSDASSRREPFTGALSPHALLVLAPAKRSRRNGGGSIAPLKNDRLHNWGLCCGEWRLLLTEEKLLLPSESRSSAHCYAYFCC